MSQAANPKLEAGRTYRTQELRRYSANPARLAKRLVREGKLRKAAHGLFYAPKSSRFGQAPASEQEILRGFLGPDSPFVITGPPRWNALGLRATSLFASTLVYNHKRTGEFTFDHRRFVLRRVLFPDDPPHEWFAVDLIQNHDMAGVSLAELTDGLVATLRQNRWNRDLLRQMADEYGTKATLALVERCLHVASDKP